MIIKSLKTENFRNLKNLKLEFDEKTTLIYGDNGQGKTNILEAIWLLSCGKSFRNTQDKDLISFNKKNSKVEVIGENEIRDIKLNAEIFKDKKKQILIDSEPIKKNAELMGKLVTVLFLPENLNMIKGGPENRRKFLDISLCQQYLGYYNALREYNFILNGRNALLKQVARKEQGVDLLEVWDDALAIRASRIALYRQNYINLLNEPAKKNLKEISNNKEDLIIEYDSFFNKTENNDFQASFKEKLKATRETDLMLGSTSVGCHRDDIDIIVNGVSLKRFGSQGQKKSAVIALKLAEGELIWKTLNIKPIFLLDDVLSELDENRKEYIISRINEYQVVITDCLKPEKKKGLTYYIKNGEATLE